MQNNNPLTEFVLSNTPRMLGWIDRRKGSPTYGCADRNYWHYKIVDFPCSMLQETALTLSLLYSTKFNSNKYYKSVFIKELVIGQIKYWANIQNNDGSFDEFYPNEHSFSATAFTLYSSCYSLKILGVDPTFIKNVAKRACRFLVNYENPGASNQIAAAIAAINRYSNLFSDSSYDERVENMLKNLMGDLNDEGWHPEYGGFDVGYQSITLAYLSDYNSFHKNKDIESSLIKSIDFLSNFIHPDGSVGGGYGSRDTSFLAPFGFAYNIENSSKSAAILDHVFLNKNSDINNFIDDRYICHFLLPSYLLSLKAVDKIKNFKLKQLPFKNKFTKYYTNSGLYIKSSENYYMIVNLKKNGVLNLFQKNDSSCILDSGYLIKDKSNIFITSCLNNISNVDIKEDEIKVTGKLFSTSNKVPSSVTHAALRILTYFGRGKILPLLKKYFILRNKPNNFSFSRTIKFGLNSIFITDNLYDLSRRSISIYKSNSNTTFRYVAPSNYFNITEINNLKSDLDINNVNIDKVKIEKEIDIKSFKITESSI